MSTNPSNAVRQRTAPLHAIPGGRDRYADVGAASRAAMERAAHASLRGRTYRVLLGVLSLTTGWSRLADRVTHAQLGAACGVDDRRALTRELRCLADAGLIVYQPGGSRPDGTRYASVVGLPAAPAVDVDPRSPDRGSEPARTPGRVEHGPPVDVDRPSEEYPENPPSAHTRDTPPDVAAPDVAGGGDGRPDPTPTATVDVAVSGPRRLRSVERPAEPAPARSVEHADTDDAVRALADAFGVPPGRVDGDRVSALLDDGWTAATMAREAVAVAPLDGVRNPAAVLRVRLDDLAARPSPGTARARADAAIAERDAERAEQDARLAADAARAARLDAAVAALTADERAAVETEARARMEARGAWVSGPTLAAEVRVVVAGRPAKVPS